MTSAAEDSRSVTVVDKPLEAPKIYVEENGFQIGKVLKANCTSKGGYPPANLTWLVDGEKVASNAISGPKQYVNDGEVDVSVSELMLPITVAPRSGHIKLTCTATQYTMYSVSTELQVDLKEVTASSSTKLMNMFLAVMKGKGNVFISAVMASSIYLLHIIH
uniref:Ig-like domain-containing protein n=2 Tax=Homalodisca liturata TaxID=320908 RepID=A0A1B6JYR4_9HEMI